MTVRKFIEVTPKDELYGTWVTFKVNSSGKAKGIPHKRFCHRILKGVCQRVEMDGQQTNLIVRIFGKDWARNMSFGEGTQIVHY